MVICISIFNIWDFMLFIITTLHCAQDVLLLKQFISPEGLVVGRKKTGGVLMIILTLDSSFIKTVRSL